MPRSATPRVFFVPLGAALPGRTARLSCRWVAINHNVLWVFPRMLGARILAPAPRPKSRMAAGLFLCGDGPAFANLTIRSHWNSLPGPWRRGGPFRQPSIRI